MRKFLAALVALTSVLVAAPAAAGAKAAPTTSQVYVTHGLPLDTAGTKVDVYVNGALTLDDFTFGTTAGPLTLPAATYNVEIKTPDGASTLITKSVAVPAGGNFSLVASYIDAAGTPGINVFANKVSRIARTGSRVALHHAAAAPSVDVLLGRFPISRKIPRLRFPVAKAAPNGAQANLWLRAGRGYTFDVNVAGTKTTVLSLDNAKFPGRTLTNVYVVGSASGGTLQFLTSSIKL
jgi:hypothetical protein